MSDRIEIAGAPCSGYMLAYYRKKIVFCAYDGTEDPQQLVYGHEAETGELLELHLFDAEKEFRAVNTRAGSCLVSQISDEDMRRKGVCEQLTEEMYLEDDYRSLGSALRVVNYLSYGENGMIQVVNYRLAGVTGKEQENGK